MKSASYLESPFISSVTVWKHRGEADGCPSCLTDAIEIPPLPLAHASFLTPNRRSASGIVTVKKLPNQFRYFAEKGMPSYFSLFIFCLLIGAHIIIIPGSSGPLLPQVVFQLMPGQSVRRASDLLAAQCLILLLLVANLDRTVKNVKNTFTDRAVRWRINSLESILWGTWVFQTCYFSIILLNLERGRRARTARKKVTPPGQTSSSFAQSVQMHFEIPG